VKAQVGGRSIGFQLPQINACPAETVLKDGVTEHLRRCVGNPNAGVAGNPGKKWQHKNHEQCSERLEDE
jgi:hypothetical protein